VLRHAASTGPGWPPTPPRRRPVRRGLAPGHTGSASQPSSGPPACGGCGASHRAG
jgi:hypothetical protein